MTLYSYVMPRFAFLFTCSYGVVLWELLTGGIPYSGLGPFQTLYAVAEKHMTLDIPSSCPSGFTKLMKREFFVVSIKL